MNQLKALRFFWLGFAVYTIGYTLSATMMVNYIICQAFQSMGLLVFVAASTQLIVNQYDNKNIKYYFSLFLIWQAGTVIRGIHFDYEFLKFLLLDGSFGIFIYMAPLILLFPRKLIFYNRIFDVIVSLGLVSIVLELLFIKQLLNRDLTDLISQNVIEAIARNLGLACGFLVINYRYNTKRRNYLAFLVVVLTIFFSILRARRGLIFMASMPLLIAYLVFAFTSKTKFLPVFSTILIVGVISVYGLLIFNNSHIFDSVRERGFEDTRTYVENAFYKDMREIDWIMGRGLDGRYYCPDIEYDGSVYRSVIETGYLQIILKGGLISLALFLFIILPAAFKGIFRSKNMLSKTAGIWIVLWTLSLIPATGNSFNMSYLLLWVSVGICYSAEIRYIPDEILRLSFLRNEKTKFNDKDGATEDIDNRAIVQ